jgi:hypothetical protein
MAKRLPTERTGELTRWRAAPLPEQTIGALGWEFDSHRAVVGRLVQTDANVNWHLAFRNSGGLGHEMYLIVGDPNAARFDTRVAVKWVWAR